MISEEILLRLHVEAVWGVRLPPIETDELELLPESRQPPWDLCLAEITDGRRIYIWRPSVNEAEREELRRRGGTAWDFSPTATPVPNIDREVALFLVASPVMDLATAHSLARLLTAQDSALIELEGLHSDNRPVIGVVVEGRLLCLAHSSRRTAEACELGIETVPEARRRGYALACTILWTQAVAQEGIIPIYSASAENTASLRLAAAAGYRAFARVALLKN